MKAFEIFRELEPDTLQSIFQYLREEQREIYSASLATLAANRKLRPVFVQRKPATQQITWLCKNIKLKGSAEVADQVIQIWLMKGHQQMLEDFLDGMGIEHEEGAADDLPDELDAKKLKSTTDSLLEKYDPEIVRSYLHTFQSQRPGGWEELSKLLKEEPALRFGDADDEAEANVAEEKSSDSSSPDEEKSAAASKENSDGAEAASSEEEKPAPAKKASTKKKSAAKKKSAK